MKTRLIAATVFLFVACSASSVQKPAHGQTAEAILDDLLAPIALYPDQLLGQMLICMMDPVTVKQLDTWLTQNPTLRGTDLQDAAVKNGFDASYVALALFPQVVTYMSSHMDWTRTLGQYFSTDRSSVFASIQRLRKKAQGVGTLKTTPQQEVTTKTTAAGDQAIVIEPANPQVVYVPQYNSQTVYTTAPTTT